MRALKQGQLTRLYFPHLKSHPLVDSENTTELIISAHSIVVIRNSAVLQKVNRLLNSPY